MAKLSSLLMLGLAGMLGLALTGCKYDRDEREDGTAFYNDVGETDIDRRVYASARRGQAADMPVPQEDQRVAERKRFSEVGEMSLDTEMPAPRQAKAKKVKTEAKAPAVKPVSAAPVAPAKPVTVVRPVAPAPVAVQPARRVPAPAPAPEYVAAASAKSHNVSVGETELGN